MDQAVEKLKSQGRQSVNKKYSQMVNGTHSLRYNLVSMEADSVRVCFLLDGTLCSLHFQAALLKITVNVSTSVNCMNREITVL